jgi:hypothetical protein
MSWSMNALPSSSSEGSSSRFEFATISRVGDGRAGVGRDGAAWCTIRATPQVAGAAAGLAAFDPESFTDVRKISRANVTTGVIRPSRWRAGAAPC